MNTVQEQLEANGFALLENFATPAEIENLLASIETARRVLQSTSSAREAFSIRDLLHVVPEVRDWAASPEVVEVM